MPRRIGCATRNAMSAARRVVIPAPATTSAACRPRPARYGCEGTEAAPADIRDGHYRALSAARELGRGGADRDVSGGGIGAPGRGHHGGPVGHAGVAVD